MCAELRRALDPDSPVPAEITATTINQSIDRDPEYGAQPGETYWITAIERPPDERAAGSPTSAFIHFPARPSHVADIPKHEAFTPDWKLSEDTVYRSIQIYVCMFRCADNSIDTPPTPWIHHCGLRVALI